MKKALITAIPPEDLASMRQALTNVRQPDHRRSGQLSLFLTTLNFLTRYVNHERSTVIQVIVIGVETGEYLAYLAPLFPDVQFVVYRSPIKEISYSKVLISAPNTSRNLKLMDVEFTERDAESTSLITKVERRGLQRDQKEVLLISHLKSERKTVSEALMDTSNALDMKKQYDWYMKIRPIAALLRFAPPMNVVEFRYPNGINVVKPWSDNTFETYLILTSDVSSEMKWTIDDYKTRMMYHNRIARVTDKYISKFALSDKMTDLGIRGDFDSMFTTNIIMDYLFKITRGQGITNDNIQSLTEYILISVDPRGRIKTS